MNSKATLEPKAAPAVEPDAVLPPEGCDEGGALTTKEAADFEHLNQVIHHATQSLAEATAALCDIRDRRLYRADYATFEEYCQNVHHMGRRYANRLIKAGGVRIEMGTILPKTHPGLPLPSTEAQLHVLGRLPDVEARCEVYAAAVEAAENDGGKVTAKIIEAEVVKLLPPKAPRKRRVADNTSESLAATASREMEETEEATPEGNTDTGSPTPDEDPQPRGAAPPEANDHLLQKLRIILSQIRDEAHGQRRKDLLIELTNELDGAISDAFGN